MGKKLLYAGIILILFPLFFIIEQIEFGFFCILDCWVLDYLVMLVIAIPLMIKGLFLLRKYFRSRKTEKQFIDSQNYQDKPKKYEPKTNDSPIEILKDRLAKGEISDEEYVELKKMLE